MRVFFETVFILTSVAIVASGVLGLIARTKVPHPPGRGQAVAAVLRIAVGAVLIAAAIFNLA
ncbi:MAG: hypothetical protein WBB76_01595 [Gaiellaceae bacterium]